MQSLLSNWCHVISERYFSSFSLGCVKLTREWKERRLRETHPSVGGMKEATVGAGMKTGVHRRDLLTRIKQEGKFRIISMEIETTGT